MANWGEMVLYGFTFLSVYVQLFFLITFLEHRKKIVNRKGVVQLDKYHGVTVMIPCWNEEKTVYKTVRSLLNQNYPQDKLSIFLIDDGSTDNTYQVISRFAKYKNVKVFRKENGGKSSALNLGLSHVETPFLGCLDADSEAHPDALRKIMSYFEKDEMTMAVAPTVLITTPKTFIQKAQKAEYDMYAYLKKMLGLLGAIHVTPGPLTIFRKKVFDDLGPYRHAHNTEDMEIAYRMQKHDYKIEQCHDAMVYTNTPPSISTLFKQRLRWLYGFVNNTIDYRGILFKKKYGNFSIFTIPANIISVFSVCFVFAKIAYDFFAFIANKISQYKVIGVDFNYWSGLNQFDLYFVDTRSLFVVSIVILGLLITSISIGRYIAEEKWVPPSETFYFLVMFGIMGPLWILKALYNTVLSRKPAWR